MGLTIETKAIKDVCSKILFAIDTEEKSVDCETLEMYTEGEFLVLCVTNREYYVQVKLELDKEVDFHATVDAITFVKLISQTTTDTIDILVEDGNLIVNGNGKYTFPMVYVEENNEKRLLSLPRIELQNVTAECTVKSDSLLSILKYNSKELSKTSQVSSLTYIQRLYYLDSRGAITFTNGAVVNDFDVDAKIKVLMSGKTVKLFKLFSKGELVDLKLSNDADEDTIKTKISLQTDTITLHAILPCDDTLMDRYPVSAIRGRSDKEYEYSVVLRTDDIVKALNRISIFSGEAYDVNSLYCTFSFSNAGITIKDGLSRGVEVVKYEDGTVCPPKDNYEMLLNTKEVISTFSSYTDNPFITMKFGDSAAAVLQTGNIKVVIPEVHLS